LNASLDRRKAIEGSEHLLELIMIGDITHWCIYVRTLCFQFLQEVIAVQSGILNWRSGWKDQMLSSALDHPSNDAPTYTPECTGDEVTGIWVEKWLHRAWRQFHFHNLITVHLDYYFANCFHVLDTPESVLNFALLEHGRR
jgi:hypothetical protein